MDTLKRKPYLAGKGKPVLIPELPWKKYDGLTKDQREAIDSATKKGELRDKEGRSLPKYL